MPYLWSFLFILCPLLFIGFFSFGLFKPGIPPYEPLWQWLNDSLLIRIHFGNYKEIFQSSFYITAYLNSLILALAATVGSLLIIYPLVYSAWRVSPVWRFLILTLLLLPYATSFMIRLYALNGLLGPDSYLMTLLTPLMPYKPMLGSHTALVLGMMYAYAPFMTYPIYLSLTKIPVPLLEAAVDLGAHHTHLFWQIIAPLSLPGVVTGCTLVFVSSFCDGVIPEILGEDTTLVMGRLILHTFFHERNWPKSCALALLSLTALFFPWALGRVCRQPYEK